MGYFGFKRWIYNPHTYSCQVNDWFIHHKNGKDVFIRVPCGTAIHELTNSPAFYDEDNEDEEDESENEVNESEMNGEDEDIVVNDNELESMKETEEVDDNKVVHSSGGIEWEYVGDTSQVDESEGRTFEITKHNQIILVARGGKPGLGNLTTKNSNNTSKSRKPTLVSIIFNEVGCIVLLLLL